MLLKLLICLMQTVIPNLNLTVFSSLKWGGVFSGTEYSRTVDNSILNINGGTNWATGSRLQLYGKNSSDPGAFAIYATSDANTRSILYGKPDGTLTWGSKNVAMQEDVVPRDGGSVLRGDEFARNVNNSYLVLSGGNAWLTGGCIAMYGPNTSSRAGELQFFATDGKDTTEFNIKPNGKLYHGCLDIARLDDTSYIVLRGGTTHTSAYIMCYGISSSTRAGWVRLCPTSNREMNLKPDGTWTWDGTAVQLTSDKRLKQQITQIDNALLDAWEDVTLVQFKYNDAVEEKGTKARLHTGYVVQQIDDACKSHNLDISAYGLYCHEDYPERTEEVEVQQEDGTTKKETKVIEEASEHYSLRYTEALVVECAYLRRENNRLKERLSKIEKLLNI